MSVTPQGALLKRYLLFAGESYYPIGGWHDFKGSFDTLEEADSEVTRTKLALKPHDWAYDWFHIVDLETGEVVRIT